MRNAPVFKKRYIAIPVLIIFLILCYICFNFPPVGQSIIKKVKVNNLANLYITQVSAGATTAFSYRYYLYDASKSDQEFMDNLQDISPFLIIADDKAIVKIENEAIHLQVKGDIYAFNSPAGYRVSTGLYTVGVYLKASPW